MDDPFFDAVGTAFPYLFAVGAIIIIGGFVVVIVAIVRNARRAADAGHNPFTMQTDLAVKLLDSKVLAADAPLEQRLAELDDLRSRGVITAEEHQTARAQVLSGR